MSHNANSGESGRMAEKKYASRNKVNDLKKNFLATSNTNNSGPIDQSTIGETVNHKLGDIFSNNGD
jgi:hypothetical protein